jgi:hypothetical protein
MTISPPAASRSMATRRLHARFQASAQPEFVTRVTLADDEVPNA